MFNHRCEDRSHLKKIKRWVTFPPPVYFTLNFSQNVILTALNYAGACLRPVGEPSSLKWLVTLSGGGGFYTGPRFLLYKYNQSNKNKVSVEQCLHFVRPLGNKHRSCSVTNKCWRCRHHTCEDLNTGSTQLTFNRSKTQIYCLTRLEQTLTWRRQTFLANFAPLLGGESSMKRNRQGNTFVFTEDLSSEKGNRAHATF